LIIYALSIVGFLLFSQVNAQNNDQNKVGSTSNYTTYNTSDGWSLELPASWTVTKEVNNDLNEAIQANADNTLNKMNLKKTIGNANVQFFAFKSFLGEKISLAVSTQKLNNPLFQNDLKKLDESEKKYFLDQSKRGIKASLSSVGYDPNAEIYTELVSYHNFIATVNEIRDPSSNITKTIIIPNGNNLLRLEFNYRRSGMEIFPSFITRIAESVHLP
jgi:hypothetical protein